jgi:polyisoprenoid-binding protein YceI
METTVAEKTGTATWTLDKMHAKAGFNITHMLISEIDGHFKDFDVKVSNAKEDLSGADIEFTAQVNSIDTSNSMRDEHMRKDDFFHVEKFPTITFKSKLFKKLDDRDYKLNGDLTLMGVTKNIDLKVVGAIGTHPMNQKTIAGFKITGTVKRSDFGLAPTMPALALSDEVRIVVNAEFIKG